MAWAAAHGLVMMVEPDVFAHAPCTLLPVPVRAPSTLCCRGFCAAALSAAAAARVRVGAWPDGTLQCAGRPREPRHCVSPRCAGRVRCCAVAWPTKCADSHGARCCACRRASHTDEFVRKQLGVLRAVADEGDAQVGSRSPAQSPRVHKAPRSRCGWASIALTTCCTWTLHGAPTSSKVRALCFGVSVPWPALYTATAVSAQSKSTPSLPRSGAFRRARPKCIGASVPPVRPAFVHGAAAGSWSSGTRTCP